MARKSATEIPVGHLFVKYKKAKGETSVYLSYFMDGQTIPISTKVKVFPTDWDNVKERVLPKDKEHERKNNRLADIKRTVDKRLQDFYNEGNAITAADVRRILKGEELAKKRSTASGSFLAYAKETNDLRYQGEKKGYTTWYNNDLYIKKFGLYLQTVHGVDDIKLREMNADYVVGYIKWREERLNNTSREGINKTLTPLIQAMERAASHDLVPNKVVAEMRDTYLQQKSRQYTGENDDSEEIRCLTEEQLQQFVALYATVGKTTQRYMDLFLFSFHTCGLRVSDILTLEWNHIDFAARRLHKNLVKFNKPYEVALNDSAISILKRYENTTERFVFGLFPADFNLKDPDTFLKKRNSVNRTIQYSLNAIGRKMNLDFNLGMHVARHTFGVMALKKGVSLHMISVLMGHSSIAVTEKHYAKFLKEDKDDVVKNILSFNYLPY